MSDEEDYADDFETYEDDFEARHQKNPSWIIQLACLIFVAFCRAMMMGTAAATAGLLGLLQQALRLEASQAFVLFVFCRPYINTFQATHKETSPAVHGEMPSAHVSYMMPVTAHVPQKQSPTVCLPKLLWDCQTHSVAVQLSSGQDISRSHLRFAAYMTHRCMH